MERKTEYSLDDMSNAGLIELSKKKLGWMVFMQNCDRLEEANELLRQSVEAIEELEKRITQ